MKKVLVASGIRMDLARRSPEYMRELAEHHVGGHLKVAPEHIDPEVLDLMKKPGVDDFVEFDREFARGLEAAGKKQYLVPYFIASHPGSDAGLDDRPGRCSSSATLQARPGAGFHSQPVRHRRLHVSHGLDPFTKKPVFIAKHLRDRKLQRALLQFFKPENYFEVRRALEQAGRQDLIGSGCDCADSETARPRRRSIAAANARTINCAQQTSGDHIRSGPKDIARMRKHAPSIATATAANCHLHVLRPTNINCSISAPAASWIASARSWSIVPRQLPPIATAVSPICVRRAGRYERDRAGRGRWQRKRELTEPWLVRHQRLTCELKLSDAGQVGLFPEQSDNWDWVEPPNCAGRPAAARAQPVRPHRRRDANGGRRLAPK